MCNNNCFDCIHTDCIMLTGAGTGKRVYKPRVMTDNDTAYDRHLKTVRAYYDRNRIAILARKKMQYSTGGNGKRQKEPIPLLRWLSSAYEV